MVEADKTLLAVEHARAERKQVVLHLSHCLSSSGSNSKASLSASFMP